MTGELFATLRSEFKSSVPAQLEERKAEEASQVANIEVAEQVLYSWKDSIDSVWVNYGQ
ncbi:hypothetical protein GN156_11155 [bacterium LRH843]|nr:hypothetical protein [bacterium LRH843]